MQLLKQGEVFAGRYRVERLLARGGHGVVYVAEQVSTEAPIALKVLMPSLVESAESLERFALEARVAGRVRSEFIVKVLDAGRDDETGLAFLAMELLEGESLQALVEGEGPLAPERVCSYLAQVAAGLDRAHGYTGKDGKTRPIIHRDLKPENLFLARRETGETAIKILDFGVAKIVSETAQQSKGTKGTPLYMAVEQLSGESPTPATDIWALGLIAYFLLTGGCYWRSAAREDASVSSVFAEILTGQLAPASERAREMGHGPSLPPAFDEWFARCVHRDPKARFQSAGAAARALGEALMGMAWAATLPVGTPAPSPTPRGDAHAEPDGQVAVSQTKPDVSRPSRRGLLGLSLGLLVLGGAGWVALSTREAPSSPLRSSQPDQAETQSLASTPAPQRPSASAPPQLQDQPDASVGHVAQDAGARRSPAAAPRPRATTAPSAPVSPYDQP